MYAFTYRIVESEFVLLYIRSLVEDINSSGTRSGNCYSIPRRPTTLIRWKVLDVTNDGVSGGGGIV
jgi:hypothetical protein